MIGLSLEDIEVGLVIELGSHHFPREEILAFARAYDPQPFHLDDEAARTGPFGVLSASGWHTAAAWMKCYVATNQKAERQMRAAGQTPAEVGPSPGLEQLRWLRPVTPGDTLSFRTTITGKRELKSRPGWGLVFSHNEGFNQRGELVFCFDGKVMTPARA
ncbi:MaoC family dehydratase [Aestuariivirga sp.]|jgi:acyl dehydratase|uniref:MaoC family dehydratase n=1 Tax=Aestuariivirga sp. TaxID=2650926 RepID=UPI0037842FC8